MTIYKVFARPHLNYGDILYDQAYIISCLAITGAIRGTSNEKLCQEFGLESPYKIDGGLENCAPFLKYSETNHRTI